MSFAYFDVIFPKTSEDGKHQGFVAISLYPHGMFSESEGPTQTHFFAWPSQREDLVAFCLHNSDKDVYTVPALFKERGSRKGHNIAHQWVAYADADTLPLERLKAEPTMVVETSEGRHHAYWATETDDPQQLVDISRAIAQEHKEQGCDPGGWDAGQLLRVPGTTNNKYSRTGRPSWEIPGRPKMGPTYTLKALATAYPPYSTQDRPSVASDMPPKVEWYYTAQSIREGAEVFRASPDVLDLYVSELRPDQDRSKTLWKLLSKLARLNVSRPTAMHIAWGAKCNKFELQGRPEDDLWKELCKAYDHPDNQPVRNSFADMSYRKEADQSEENPEKKLAQFAEQVAMLRPDERDLVPTNTFVDRYQKWAATCTDAPEIYHRAGAATILSAVFGEFGKCPTKYDTNLTLWFFILGPTTRARKTTAMMMCVDFLDDLSDDDFPYVIGSDVTPEALNLLLPEKNGRTSVYYRDEAHGLLLEQSKKRYLVGSQEYETELFSGRVRNAVRVGTMKEQGEREPGIIRTNFIRLLCGTLEQVSSALSIESYQSGHMARFLVAEADPPPLTEEAMYTEQFDGQLLGEDVMRLGLLNDITAARTFWMGVTEPGNTIRVPWEDDAWKRLQKAKYVLHRAAEGHELAEVLLPTMTRMGDSMMKTAVLLAMSDRKQIVSMPHLLKAMRLTEDWYRSTARVAGKILHSRWAARQNEILIAIQSRREGVTEQDVYSRFHLKMHEKEIESALHVLGKAGRINRVLERGRVRYIPVAGK
ncbi:DNA-primase RepB domain-containing protein [Streptomyces sp. NEAU-Y11]|uniref:DNA-primase RepB domain-containing protein n=1 Tax=Streptomyces cucumeris TaxID=2962890 RepID=UPI0020C85864|nr:DNA-primase RepB domain-containing protein [Streptomyces sp. NEAU-Y11]MCP9209705.1 RepB family DNA primase [Streptomyces sp. NEAU-Y11]